MACEFSSDTKDSPCQCRRSRFDPWVGRCPGYGNGNPLQYSCLENSMDRGAWWAKSQSMGPQGVSRDGANNTHLIWPGSSSYLMGKLCTQFSQDTDTEWHHSGWRNWGSGWLVYGSAELKTMLDLNHCLALFWSNGRHQRPRNKEKTLSRGPVLW